MTHEVWNGLEAGDIVHLPVGDFVVAETDHYNERLFTVTNSIGETMRWNDRSWTYCWVTSQRFETDGLTQIQWDLLTPHVGHDIECVTYGEPPVNVTLECNTCGCVLVSHDSPE